MGEKQNFLQNCSNFFFLYLLFIQFDKNIIIQEVSGGKKPKISCLPSVCLVFLSLGKGHGKANKQHGSSENHTAKDLQALKERSSNSVFSFRKSGLKVINYEKCIWSRFMSLRINFYFLVKYSFNYRQKEDETLAKYGFHLLRSTVVTLNTTPLSHRIMKSLWEKGQFPMLSPSLPALNKHTEQVRSRLTIVMFCSWTAINNAPYREGGIIPHLLKKKTKKHRDL